MFCVSVCMLGVSERVSVSGVCVCPADRDGMREEVLAHFYEADRLILVALYCSIFE